MTNSDEMPTLKPCPFCNAESGLYFVDNIICENCGAQSRRSHRGSKESACDFWNNRPIESKLEQEITRLKERNERLEHAISWCVECYDIKFDEEELINKANKVNDLLREAKKALKQSEKQDC